MINIDDRLLDTLDEDQMFFCLQIARHMRSSKMVAWPSIATLARLCKWDERKVKNVRQSLIEMKALAMQQQPGKCAEYRFLIDGIGVYNGLSSTSFLEESQGKIDAENNNFSKEGGTENGGGEIVGGTKIPPSFSAVGGVQKMPPEDINKEAINNNLFIQEKQQIFSENFSATFSSEISQELEHIAKLTQPKVDSNFGRINPYTNERLFEIETPNEFAGATIKAFQDQMFCDRICRETKKQKSDLKKYFVQFMETWASDEKLKLYCTARDFRNHLWNFICVKSHKDESKVQNPKPGPTRPKQSNRSTINNLGGDYSQYLQKQAF